MIGENTQRSWLAGWLAGPGSQAEEGSAATARHSSYRMAGVLNTSHGTVLLGNRVWGAGCRGFNAWPIQHQRHALS
eukprot:COSAG01_NODE_55853_length_322_cov_0.914798_1_plen_75_part_01